MSRVWWWITCGAEGEEAEPLLQDLQCVPGWEQQLFVHPAGPRGSDIYTVNSPGAFCDLTSVSVLRKCEVNASLLLIRWWAVQKCQPPPFRPPELRSLLPDWRGSPCPFSRNKLPAFSSFLENENVVSHSKELLLGGQAPEESCDKCWTGLPLAHLPQGVTEHLGAWGKRQSPWRGTLRFKTGAFPVLLWPRWQIHMGPNSPARCLVLGTTWVKMVLDLIDWDWCSLLGVMGGKPLAFLSFMCGWTLQASSANFQVCPGLQPWADDIGRSAGPQANLSLFCFYHAPAPPSLSSSLPKPYRSASSERKHPVFIHWIFRGTHQDLKLQKKASHSHATWDGSAGIPTPSRWLAWLAPVLPCPSASAASRSSAQEPLSPFVALCSRHCPAASGMWGYVGMESWVHCAANSQSTIQHPLLLLGCLNEHALLLQPPWPNTAPHLVCWTKRNCPGLTHWLCMLSWKRIC